MAPGDDSSQVSSDPVPEFHRRYALCGLAVLGVAGVTLAGCGTNTTSSDQGAPRQSPSQSAGSVSPQLGAVLAAVSEVPVDGGLVVRSAAGVPVLLTQPTQGVIKAFDARCTHQGTVVDQPQGGIATCPNHGSRFNIVDGSVVRGPAAAPLRAVSVTVKDGNIVTA